MSQSPYALIVIDKRLTVRSLYGAKTNWIFQSLISWFRSSNMCKTLDNQCKRKNKTKTVCTFRFLTTIRNTGAHKHKNIVHYNKWEENEIHTHISYVSPNGYILYKIFTLFLSLELFCACVVLLLLLWYISMALALQRTANKQKKNTSHSGILLWERRFDAHLNCAKQRSWCANSLQINSDIRLISRGFFFWILFERSKSLWMRVSAQHMKMQHKMKWPIAKKTV